MKLIGAGFPRTGTMSLRAALNHLGVGPCHHMAAVIGDKAQAPLWQALVDGAEPDFDTIYRGYQSTVDAPGCFYYKELMEKYPNAKVLLSVRDPERWYSSVNDSIYLTYLMPRWMEWIPRAGRIGTLGPFLKLVRTMIWEGVFDKRFKDKPHAIAIFNNHIEEVKRVVPAEKLLVFSVKEGWEPLCAFLEVPVPRDRPFPHLNAKATAGKFYRRMRLVGFLFPPIVLGLIGLVIWLLSRLF
ncbi:MAG: sulfotransferase family protein [Chloroflexota bacterium]